MTGSQFPVAIHILTLLATTNEEWLSSDYIASSININPVLVRKEIGNLRRFGLVASKTGKSGGSRLTRNASTICLADVYHAIQPIQILGRLKNEPNQHCPIGRQINGCLEELYSEIEEAMVTNLNKITLQDFCSQFK
ncbi:MAG TPA: Rrf2 family transcriptional regulator [Balneolales bacterium]|nr:Rrf2 family transcriptional regulator [Balneolales bacterium]